MRIGRDPLASFAAAAAATASSASSSSTAGTGSSASAFHRPPNDASHVLRLANAVFPWCHWLAAAFFLTGFWISTSLLTGHFSPFGPSPDMAGVAASSLAMGGGSGGSGSDSGSEVLRWERLRINEVTVKYSLLKQQDGLPAPYFSFVDHLSRQDDAFVRDLLTLLRDAPFPAFFFECVPVTAATLHTQPFEFVLIHAEPLTKIASDPSPFVKFFSPDTPDAVASFLNLGKDARLVVPSAQTNRPQEDYAHLAKFVRSPVISARQKVNLFERLGTAVLATLNDPTRPADEKLWVSTSGMGVSWLHLRLDKRPKYYNHVPYKL